MNRFLHIIAAALSGHALLSGCAAGDGSGSATQSFFGRVVVAFHNEAVDTVVGLQPAPIDPSLMPPGVDPEFFRPKPYCTGFFVAPTIIMTARHCVLERFVIRRDMRAAAPDFASQVTMRSGALRFAGVFAAGADDPALLMPATRADDLLAEDETLDVALIRWRGEPRTRVVRLAAKPVARGAPVVALGHPSGLPLARADGGNALGDFDGDIRFAHDLDTLGGNSGSPVFAAGATPIDEAVVVGVHVQGGAANEFRAPADLAAQPESAEAAARHCEKMIEAGVVAPERRAECERQKSVNLATHAYQARSLLERATDQAAAP